MLVDYFSCFNCLCDFVIKDDSCLFTVANDSCQCFVGRNTILTETQDESFPKSSNALILDSESSINKVELGLTLLQV